MVEALKEWNINDITDFLMAGGPAKSEQFEKEKCALPPQYHSKSSHGDVKDCLTSDQLQSYFWGYYLKDFDLLSKLGTGVSVIDSDQDINTIGELVNQKKGNRWKKEVKQPYPWKWLVGILVIVTVYPLVVLNIFLLLWINIPLANLYMVCMVCPVLTFVRYFGNSSSTRVDPPRHYNVILILN